MGLPWRTACGLCRGTDGLAVMRCYCWAVVMGPAGERGERFSAEPGVVVAMAKNDGATSAREK